MQNKLTTALLTLSLTLALVAFSSSVALAASTPREVTVGLVMGDGPDVVLMEFRNVAITTTTHCLAISAKTDDACDNLALNYYSVPKSMKVNNLRVHVDVAGDAASTCDINIEIAGDAAGTELTAFSVVTLGAVLNGPQNLVVAEGALLGVAVNDASGCYDNTPPTISVQLEGQFLN
jgi:hypothetical protein